MEDNVLEASYAEKEDIYNDVPVHYCKSCKSLKIRIAEGFDYCDDCGGTEIEMNHINNWLIITTVETNQN